MKIKCKNGDSKVQFKIYSSSSTCSGSKITRERSTNVCGASGYIFKCVDLGGVKNVKIEECVHESSDCGSQGSSTANYVGNSDWMALSHSGVILLSKF